MNHFCARIGPSFEVLDLVQVSSDQLPLGKIGIRSAAFIRLARVFRWHPRNHLQQVRCGAGPRVHPLDCSGKNYAGGSCSEFTPLKPNRGSWSGDAGTRRP
jgi:hypothetical protein